MKVRYCETTFHRERPCDVGWGSVGNKEVSCWDKPIKKNCRNIVDTKDIAICPCCGTALGYTGDFLLQEKEGGGDEFKQYSP